MMTVENIITDKQLDDAWGNSNFGSISKRDVIKYTLLKCASGYHSGHTGKIICQELKLVYTNDWKLTKKGKEYLYYAFCDNNNF